MSKKHKKESYEQLELNLNPMDNEEVDMEVNAEDEQSDPVVIDEELLKAVEKNYEKTAIVKVAKLNLREDPSKESRVIMVLERGTKLDVEECLNDEWYFVNVKGKIQGYIMKEFVEVNA